MSNWKELGTYQAVFSVWGQDQYQSEIVRSCIRPLAEMTSKAHVRCSDKRIERLLNNRPNMYMNGSAFLYKIRVRLELLNTAFIYLQRDDTNKIIGFYPVPYSSYEALDYEGRLYVKFFFSGTAADSLTLPWEDLVALRKDYNKSDIAGDSNEPILNTIEMLNTVNQGLTNSIKTTSSIRGILKSTKAMLAPEKIKQMKDDFVRDYLSLDGDGIASLDSTQEFKPVEMKPMTASYEETKDIRENIYRYFGINEKIIMGDIKTEELENFHKLRIEPVLIQLSLELESKIFSGKAGSYEKNFLVYESEAGQFITMGQKLELYQKVVLYAGMTRNEWRKYMNLPPIEGGDVLIMRLDAGVGENNKDIQEEEDDSDGSKG